MIKASELRIGNYIGLNLKEFPDNYFTVVEVAEESAVFTEGLEWHPMRDRQYFNPYYTEGIELTPEWLDILGLKDNRGIWRLETGGSTYIDWFDDGSWTLVQLNNEIPMVGPIDHVHQLQNLFFALTGRELELKK